jgi:peptide/nickel transport system substrate-binding protein
MSSRAFCSNEHHAASSGNNRAVARRRHPRRSLSCGAVLAAGALILAACSGSVQGTGISGGTYGKVPPPGHPETGGVISTATLAGSTPTFIFPVTPDALSTGGTDLQFQAHLFAPLYHSFYTAAGLVDEGTSAANPPVFTDGDKTVTITLKRTFRWSDGRPVDASDLIFFMDLVKAALQENGANFLTAPGLYPSNVASVTTRGQYTVILHLTRSFNPEFFTKNQLIDNLFPLPSTVWNVASTGGPHLDYTVPANARKIYDYLAKQGGQLSTFATNPLWKVVDGPFKLSSFSATNGSYTLVPNPSYGGSPKAQWSAFQVESETSDTAALNAFKAGSIDMIYLTSDQVSEIPNLRSQYHAAVWGVPYNGFTPAILNFHDATGHFDKIIAQPYARQALEHLVDQPAYIKGVYKGAAVASYTGVPQGTPWSPAGNPYPYNQAAAARLLSAHGWKVVKNGQTTCERPGTGTGECGAGIPAGTPFRFTWFYSTGAPDLQLESQAFASAAKGVGIDVILGAKTYNYIYANFDDAAGLSDANDWGVSFGGTFGTYADPTLGQGLSTSAGYNYGGYSNSAANRLFAASEYGSNPNAVKTELSFLSDNLPWLFFPVQDVFLAARKGIGSTAQGWLYSAHNSAYQYIYKTKT